MGARAPHSSTGDGQWKTVRGRIQVRYQGWTLAETRRIVRATVQ